MCLALGGETRIFGSLKATFLCSGLKRSLLTLGKGSDEALLGCCYRGMFAAHCSLVEPAVLYKKEEKETGELRGQCWQMREELRWCVSLLKTTLGRSPFSMLPESDSSKGEALWAVI